MTNKIKCRRCGQPLNLQQKGYKIWKLDVVENKIIATFDFTEGTGEVYAFCNNIDCENFTKLISLYSDDISFNIDDIKWE